MSGQENDVEPQEGTNDVTEDEIKAQTATEEEPTPQESSAEDLESLQSQLEKEREQAQVNLDKALRAQAEMDNLRKRTARDIENAHKYALEKFVNELLPVIDSLELGLTAAEKADNVDDLLEGMNLTLKMFTSALEKFGVNTLDPQGEKFNPEQHEAVSMQEIEGTESGTVVTVMQKGYELNGRLVRPAMVMVSK